MVFGPRRCVPSCSVHLGGVFLPIVTEYPYLGVILTPTLGCPRPSSGHAGESSFRPMCVLPSISWGTEFFSTSPPALRLVDCALRRGGRFLLGWPSGSPVGAVFLELGWPDARHLSTSRLLSLFGRLHAMPSHGRCPLPVLVFPTGMGVSKNLGLLFARISAPPSASPFQALSVSAQNPPLAMCIHGSNLASSLALTTLSVTACVQQCMHCLSSTWISALNS